MSDIAALIDAVVRQGLGPRLKTAGFKKHSRTFTREVTGCTQIVNIQASQRMKQGRS